MCTWMYVCIYTLYIFVETSTEQRVQMRILREQLHDPQVFKCARQAATSASACLQMWRMWGDIWCRTRTGGTLPQTAHTIHMQSVREGVQELAHPDAPLAGPFGRATVQMWLPGLWQILCQSAQPYLTSPCAQHREELCVWALRISIALSWSTDCASALPYRGEALQLPALHSLLCV